MRARFSLLALASLPLSVPRAQQVVYEIDGLGSGAAPVGDFDRDGVGDLVIGSDVLVSGRTGARLAGKLMARGFSPSFPESAWSDRNQHGLGDLDGDGIPEVQDGASVYSGADLLAPPVRAVVGFRSLVPLFSFAPPPVNLGFLGSAVPLDDLDGDGLPEFLLGWPDVYWIRCPSDHPTSVRGPSDGIARVLSAGALAPLREFQGDASAQALGGVVARLGDLDRDGFDDFAVATRAMGTGYFCNAAGGDVLRVYSARQGNLLWQHHAAPLAIVGLDDLDRDRIPDVALGFPYSSAVELRSGANGALLARIAHPPAQGFDLFGFQLVPLVDLDGDGKRDLAIAAPQPLTSGLFGGGTASGPGHVNVLGTRTLTLVADLSGEAEGEEFGADIDPLGDVNGDGRTELLVESRRAPSGPRFRALTLTGITPRVLRR